MKKVKIQKAVKIAAVFTVTCAALVTQALAASNGTAVAQFPANFLGEIKTVYYTFTSAAMALATVAFAAGGMKMLFGGKQDTDKALKQMKFALVALVCLYMLPMVMALGKQVGRAFAWNPNVLIGSSGRH